VRERARLLLGVACVLVGAALTLRPFTSLDVLVVFVAACVVASGLSELASLRTAPSRWLAIAAGFAWIAAGVLVLAWAGITIHALAIVAGISLVLGGVARIGQAARGRADDGLIAVLIGAANVIFGVLALSWPDLTVLVLALLVGPSTMIVGFGQIAAARRHQLGRRPTALRGHLPRWVRAMGAALALVVALGLAGISAALHHASASLDSFYSAPGSVPSRPGVLVRSEPFTRGVPDDWRAWRILYTTSRDDGVPALASGLVIAAKDAPPGPRPVIAWAHGTTGVAPQCAPSVLESRWGPDIIPGLNQVIRRGWVIVATDYIGLGTKGPHPYLIGQGEARSVLDSVRAARRMPQLALATKTVVWGHSQGGHAALWAGEIAPTYAPDVNVVGVAALAPASDLKALVDDVRNTLEGRIISAYVLTAYSQNYRDVSFDHYVRPAARFLVREAAKRCLDLPEAIPSAATIGLSRQPIYAVDPLGGAMGRRLAENTPTRPIRVPVLIAQGLEDPLVRPTVQRAYVNQRCHAGQSIEYRTYNHRDHLSLLWPGSSLVPYLLAWTQARFAGRATSARCSVAAR
jgi:uncharacterized membrane protein HdeD (DUF308 family)